LVAADAGDGPELGEEAGAGTVHGEVLPVEPLDAAVAPGDDREPLPIVGDPETEWTPEATELLKGG
jgi:hypothetical protein